MPDPVETPGLDDDEYQLTDDESGGSTEQLSGPSQDDQSSNGHPAWQQILDVLPDEALRNMVLPHLQEWDRGVQQRFQSLHSQIEPWKPVMDGFDPELVQQAIGLVQRLEEDPKYVFDALAQTYGFGSGTVEQGTPGTQEENEPVLFGDTGYDPNDPLVQKVTQLEGVLGSLHEFITAQQRQEQMNQEITEYNQLMETLKAKYPGPYDEDIIDTMVANEIDPEVAIQRYQASVKQAAQQMITPQVNAPNVMGGSAGGSGLPSGQINPATLDSKGTRQLAEAIIKREMGIQ